MECQKFCVINGTLAVSGARYSYTLDPARKWFVFFILLFLPCGASLAPSFSILMTHNFDTNLPCFMLTRFISVLLLKPEPRTSQKGGWSAGRCDRAGQWYRWSDTFHTRGQQVLIHRSFRMSHDMIFRIHSISLTGIIVARGVSQCCYWTGWISPGLSSVLLSAPSR